MLQFTVNVTDILAGKIPSFSDDFNLSAEFVYKGQDEWKMSLRLDPMDNKSVDMDWLLTLAENEETRTKATLRSLLNAIWLNADRWLLESFSPAQIAQTDHEREKAELAGGKP